MYSYYSGRAGDVPKYREVSEPCIDVHYNSVESLDKFISDLMRLRDNLYLKTIKEESQ